MKKINVKQLHFISNFWLKRLIITHLCILLLIYPVTSSLAVTFLPENPRSVNANLLKTAVSNYQQNKVQGVIKDGTTGEPLAGVTVQIKATPSGTITDVNGRFSLPIPTKEAILVFSFIGFQTQEITAAAGAELSISMVASIKEISEVVIVGYGTQKKTSVVAAVATVNSKDLETRGGTYNLAQALSGQLGGVTVMEKTGEPGREDPQILIRGQSTWNGSQPLILVDGIERRMSDIDISEVANVSVLKDASATAVFGVRGANGVILVTTKRGELGKPQLSFTANTGWKSFSKLGSNMDAYEAQSWRNEAVIHEVSTNEASWAYFTPYEQLIRSKKPQTDPYTYLYPNVDWKKVLFRNNAPSSRYNMNLSGGTDFAKYFASVGYIHEGDLYKSTYNEAKGYDPGYAYDRFNFRGNLDFNLTKTTVLTSNLSGYFGTRKQPASDFSISSQYFLASGYYDLAPDAFPVKYPNGFYGGEPGDQYLINPIAVLQEGGVQNENRREISSDVKLVQKLDFFTKGLSFSANLSYSSFAISSGPTINDGGNQGQAQYEQIKPSILDAQSHQDSVNAINYWASLQKTGINDFDYVMQPWQTGAEGVNSGSLERALFYQGAINYNREFTKHVVSALFLFNRNQISTGSSFTSYREDWVGRVTYNYNNKYYFEANGAYNGSEKFSIKYRFGFFPSVAFGWMVSNEDFLKRLTWLTKFKIRGSIGRVGSDQGIPPWGYVGSWLSSGLQTTTFDPSGNFIPSPYSSYYEGTIPNFNIHWETATKRNIGTEISILTDLLTLDVDLFNENRDEIFMTSDKRNIPDFFGAKPVPANLGGTETKGYELALGFNKRWANKIGVWVKLGMTRATDRITRSEDPQLLPAYQKLVGFQIDQTKTQIRTGYMNNWDDVYASVPSSTEMNYRLPGDWNINDFNGDGIIDTYDNAPFAYPQRPQNTYNASAGFNIGNLNFMVQFYGVNNISLSPYLVTPGLTRWVAVSDQYRNYWTPQNTDAYYKAPRLATNSASGDFYIQDASFVRLKTMEISYSIPTKFLRVVGISKGRIYVNGNNLFLWSKFPVDIETGSVSLSDAYPTYKVINTGIEISF
jgi:TonB-linked SusC/RagA family outer membrane protein